MCRCPESQFHFQDVTAKFGRRLRALNKQLLMAGFAAVVLREFLLAVQAQTRAAGDKEL